MRIKTYEFYLLNPLVQSQERKARNATTWETPARTVQINREHVRPRMKPQENRLGHRDGPDLDLKGDREALMLAEATPQRILRSRTRSLN